MLLTLYVYRYPSLLESSDVEGGSTAAVLTYLYHILESIEQNDLVHRILHFLLASDSSSATSNADMSVSRRKSLDVLAAFKEEAARPSPSLFNLRDLALLGLRSANRQTILATLRLLTVVLQRHHPFTRSLIQTVPGQLAKQRTVGALNVELEGLFSLATSIVGERSLNETYENYLKDAAWILEANLCIAPAETSLDDATAGRALELQQGDPLIRELLACLKDFFTNSVVVNLALTEVLMSIASSHLLSLDGWILVDPSKYDYPSQSAGPDTELSIMDQIRLAYEEPSWSPTDSPILTTVLQGLVQQTQEWRRVMPDFDILVAARRDLLHQDDEPVNARSSGVSVEPPQARGSQRDSDLAFSRGRSSGILDTSRNSASASPQQRAAIGSPHRTPSTRPLASRESSLTRAEELRKRLSAPFIPFTSSSTNINPESLPTTKNNNTNDAEQQQPFQPPPRESEEGQPYEDKNQPDNKDESAVAGESPASATLGHVLTNVIILYEFLLELSATVQVRGSLYEEAGFPGVGVDMTT